MDSIKVKPLTEQNFKLYGKLIKKPNIAPDAAEKSHNWWGDVVSLYSEGEVSVGILQVKKREFVVSELEEHVKTAEMIAPIEGNSILVVGKKSADGKIEEIDAFYLNSNQMVIMNKGTLHWVPFPFEDEATYAIVFRSKTPEDDLEFIKFKEDIKLIL